MKNQAYTEAFARGMRAALTREEANKHARALPVAEGDAFLAGYYAEKRRARFDAETAEMDYRAQMIDAGRGRLLR